MSEVNYTERARDELTWAARPDITVSQRENALARAQVFATLITLYILQMICGNGEL